ncbi:MAG: tryptophan synthase subunit alpha, partial [Desulfovibrio sp.]|nr:tryptophan synthase subunit alpha [Desulfovibrio sp.]
MHILEEKIRAARAAGRHALIPFVTFGFPDEKRFWP